MSDYKDLQKKAYEANMELDRRGLVLYTFGNASQLDRDRGVFAIKPSGVPYDRLRPEDMVVLNLAGEVVAGTLRPSSDTPSHLCLYQKFDGIAGIVHTHSTHATAWAQTGKCLPCYGTTHADYVHGDIPCTEFITRQEIQRGYEYATGEQIVAALSGRDPLKCPMVLVAGHAPFTWGKNAAEAVYHAVVLEELAKMAQLSLAIAPDLERLPAAILDKHFERKHGAQAYYGQKK